MTAPAFVALAEVCEGLDQSDRATRYPDGSAESTAAHSAMLALFALQYAEWDGVDGRAAAVYALLHDLSDARYPDVNTMLGLTPEQERAKRDAEEEATRGIYADLGLGAGPVDQATAQLAGGRLGRAGQIAAWVKLADKILPKILHLRSGFQGLPPDVGSERMKGLHDAQAGKLAPIAHRYAMPVVMAFFHEVSDACFFARRAQEGHLVERSFWCPRPWPASNPATRDGAVLAEVENDLFYIQSARLAGVDDPRGYILGGGMVQHV